MNPTHLTDEEIFEILSSAVIATHFRCTAAHIKPCFIWCNPWQAMTEFHESVVGRLERIDQWMERWEERISKRRPSACSARSALSKSTLRPSTSGRKYQAGLKASLLYKIFWCSGESVTIFFDRAQIIYWKFLIEYFSIGNVLLHAPPHFAKKEA